MPLGGRLLPKVKPKAGGFPLCKFYPKKSFVFLIRTMPTIVAAAITALFEKMFGQNHQAVFKIIVNSFDEFFCV